MSEPSVIRSSAPGRLCLFGEHLDYLGLPVIAAAIDLRMRVEGAAAGGGGWVISKPDIGEEDRFALGGGDVPYIHGGAADFLRAAINVLRRQGVELPGAAQFRVTGEVPIQAGTSSSSSLQVAWIAALLALAGDPRASDPIAIARLAYLSEVPEFQGSGGMMDQYTSALGGLVRIDPDHEGRVTRLPARLGTFVLGHSLQPKETQRILAHVQGAARRGADWLGRRLGRFDWARTLLVEAAEAAQIPGAPRADLAVTLGALRNRDLLAQGGAELVREPMDHARLGALLSEHHAVLRDSLGISTPKIERMLEAAMAAGALGGKINGSGGGGCMFAYAPGRAEEVAEAICAQDGEAWVVELARGVEVSSAVAVPR